MAPNKVQVDIGHQHSCTFFYLVRRVFLTCAESEGKTNEQSLRVACVSTGMEKKHKHIINNNRNIYFNLVIYFGRNANTMFNGEFPIAPK